ncbi:uncharacterized protein V1518DRAFT_408662 [Limtongia smithiae]|uniref:uncharacterized protein n=1 Tax=Limtongia smithiae TaxID=1125753 RepID=UPI0034D00007
MNSTDYLTSYGWTPGTGLRKDGLRKPILVKHKKNTRGLGSDRNAQDNETWWERVFDGRLAELDVHNAASIAVKELEGKREAAQACSARFDSPLYRMFVRGEGLQGSIGPKAATVDIQRDDRGTNATITTTATTTGTFGVTETDAVTETLNGNTTIVREERVGIIITQPAPSSSAAPKKSSRSNERDTRKKRKRADKTAEYGSKAQPDAWIQAMIDDMKKQHKRKRREKRAKESKAD